MNHDPLKRVFILRHFRTYTQRTRISPGSFSVLFTGMPVTPVRPQIQRWSSLFIN